jgi:Zn-dependent protease/predicted transcriptional regulator
MRASLNIPNPFGIDITIHWTFWFVVLWAGAEGLRWSDRWQGAAFAILAILLFFGCVLIHELAHAWVAKLFGLEVNGVMLLPIGGVAKIREISNQSWQEFLIVLAGPAANLLLALVLGLIFLIIWGPGLVVGFTQSSGTVWPAIMRAIFGGGNLMALAAFLILANIMLALFNLIPAFPMDGGRIFRAMLTSFLPFELATRIAVRTGQVLAIVTIFFTLTPYFHVQSLSAILVAVFVFIGATYEDRMVRIRSKLIALRVHDAMSTVNIVRLTPGESVGTVMERVFKAPQFDLPVIVQGMLVGMLRRDDLLLALRRGEAQRLVGEIMRTDYPSVRPTDNLHTVQEHMLNSKFSTLPVLHEGTFVGLINIRDVNGLLVGQPA